MIGLFLRLVFWTMGALIVLSVLALWALLYVVVFVVSLVWTGFDSSRGPKRSKRPAMTRRHRGADETDGFGHPIPQSRFSNRR